MVNAREHRVTRRAPDAMLAEERLHPGGRQRNPSYQGPPRRAAHEASRPALIIDNFAASMGR